MAGALSWSSYSSGGRVTGGEKDTLLIPGKGYASSKRAVVYCHGAGQYGDLMFLPQHYGTTHLLRGIAEWFPVLVCDLGGPLTYANNTALSRLDTAVTWALANLAVAGTRVHLVGESMGALLALAYYKAHPTRVDTISWVQGAIDLKDIYDRNVQGVAPFIDTAYGGTYVDATQKADHNPAYIVTTGAYAGLPMASWYSPADTVCLPSIEATFAATSGVTLTRHNLGNLDGHSQETGLKVNPDEVVDFLMTNNA